MLLFKDLFKNIIKIFSWPYILVHLLAILVTYFLVISDFDWKYYLFFKNTSVENILFSAAIVGGLVPILFPIVVFIWGKLRKSTILVVSAYAVAQSAILGLVISSIYKAFTGRIHPELAQGLMQDISKVFNFGFLQGGIFWGWPSSHTTVAFAMAFTLLTLFPKNKVIKVVSLFYALYIGLGVSMTIHWFSDFFAGMLIGTVIGIVVGKCFSKIQ